MQRLLKFVAELDSSVSHGMIKFTYYVRHKCTHTKHFCDYFHLLIHIKSRIYLISNLESYVRKERQIEFTEINSTILKAKNYRGKYCIHGFDN